MLRVLFLVVEGAIKFRHRTGNAMRGLKDRICTLIAVKRLKISDIDLGASNKGDASKNLYRIGKHIFCDFKFLAERIDASARVERCSRPHPDGLERRERGTIVGIHRE